MPHYEQAVGKSDEWYTPGYVFEAMGVRFDLDVASPGASITHWIPADRCLTHHSLETQWAGFVWMNPPFGGRNEIIPWLSKFIVHGNGVCLTPDRTSAPWWQKAVKYMSAVMFVSPKIKFIDANGNEGPSPAQGTTLMAIGDKGWDALNNAKKKKLGVLFGETI